MSDKKRRLRAYPAETQVVCRVNEAGGLFPLSSRLCKRGVKTASLILADCYCLSFTVKTSELSRLLPDICEHCDSVCLGRSYREIFGEHGCTLMKNDALSILSLH